MKTPALIPMAAALLCAAAAAAQPALSHGQAVRGTLTRDDPRLPDDTRYDEFTFAARRGEAVTLRMESDAFDAYLSVGQHERGGFRELAHDDDGGGGTDARLRFVAPRDGRYVVRATSWRQDTGPYRLALGEGRGDGWDDGRPGRGGAGGRVEAGERVRDYLDERGPTLDNGSPYHLYRYRGRQGERLTLTLRSDDFDAYLVLGTPGGRHGVERALARDDDSAGDRDARLSFTLPADGEYVIRVSAFTRDVGAYRLQVQSDGRSSPPPSRRAGERGRGKPDLGPRVVAGGGR